MLNFFSIVLIILIIFFIVIFKRKYISNAFNKKNPHLIQEICNKNNNIDSLLTKNNHYQNSANKYSEFYKRKLREKMNSLFKGSAEDKLKALNLAEELADKSTLPILRKGLKDMNPEIVELSASLIRKFK